MAEETKKADILQEMQAQVMDDMMNEEQQKLLRLMVYAFMAGCAAKESA
jgi:hypothetical protein